MRRRISALLALVLTALLVAGTGALAGGDRDHDGRPDAIDNCPDTFNPDQKDSVGDGVGDACRVVDTEPEISFHATPDPDTSNGGQQGDPDRDGVATGTDNCPFIFNPGQEDLDGDGVGDVCDPDRDGDGVPNGMDNCEDVYNPGQEDAVGDGVGDACRPPATTAPPTTVATPPPNQVDTDRDGVPDALDNCKLKFNPGQEDLDGDGVGDVCDPDIDGDGVPNGMDNCDRVYNPGQKDSVGDGVGDACRPPATTGAPTTAAPTTAAPTTAAPTTAAPTTAAPTTAAPTTAAPTTATPTTAAPTPSPTPSPTPVPTTAAPTTAAPSPTPSPLPPKCGDWAGDMLTWMCTQDGDLACADQTCVVLELPEDVNATVTCGCTSCVYDVNTQSCGGACQLDFACTETAPQTCTCMPDVVEPTPSPTPAATPSPTPISTPAPVCGDWAGDMLTWLCTQDGEITCPDQTCVVLELPEDVNATVTCGCTSCVYDAVTESCGGSCQLDFACTEVSPQTCACLPDIIETPSPTPSPTPAVTSAPTPAATSAPTPMPTPAPVCGDWSGDMLTWICTQDGEISCANQTCVVLELPEDANATVTCGCTSCVYDTDSQSCGGACQLDFACTETAPQTCTCMPDIIETPSPTPSPTPAPTPSPTPVPATPAPTPDPDIEVPCGALNSNPASQEEVSYPVYQLPGVFQCTQTGEAGSACIIADMEMYLCNGNASHAVDISVYLTVGTDTPVLVAEALYVSAATCLATPVTVNGFELCPDSDTTLSLHAGETEFIYAVYKLGINYGSGGCSVKASSVYQPSLIAPPGGENGFCNYDDDSYQTAFSCFDLDTAYPFEYACLPGDQVPVPTPSPSPTPAPTTPAPTPPTPAPDAVFYVCRDANASEPNTFTTLGAAVAALPSDVSAPQTTIELCPELTHLVSSCISTPASFVLRTAHPDGLAAHQCPTVQCVTTDCCCLLELSPSAAPLTTIEGIEFRGARAGSALVLSRPNVVVSHSRFIANRNGVRAMHGSSTWLTHCAFSHQRSGVVYLDRNRASGALQLTNSTFESVHVGVTFELQRSETVVCEGEEISLVAQDDDAECISGLIKTAPLLVEECAFTGGYEAAVLMRGVSATESARVVVQRSAFGVSDTKPLTTFFPRVFDGREQRRAIVVEGNYVTVRESTLAEPSYFVSHTGHWIANHHVSPHAHLIVATNDDYAFEHCRRSPAPLDMLADGNDFCASNGAQIRNTFVAFDSDDGTPARMLVVNNRFEGIETLVGPDGDLTATFEIGLGNVDCDNDVMDKNGDIEHDDPGSPVTTPAPSPPTTTDEPEHKWTGGQIALVVLFCLVFVAFLVYAIYTACRDTEYRAARREVAYEVESALPRSKQYAAAAAAAAMASRPRTYGTPIGTVHHRNTQNPLKDLWKET